MTYKESQGGLLASQRAAGASPRKVGARVECRDVVRKELPWVPGWGLATWEWGRYRCGLWDETCPQEMARSPMWGPPSQAPANTRFARGEEDTALSEEGRDSSISRGGPGQWEGQRGRDPSVKSS